MDEQFIVSLTADRIKAGTIESAEIILGGANAAQTVIKSSTFDGTYTAGATPKWSKGTQGWLIAGNGEAVFGAASIRGSISASSIELNSNNYWIPQNPNQIPPNVTTTLFRVGDANKYILWNGSTLTIKGTLSGADGTFSGTLSAGTVSGGTVSGATISGGTIQIGSGENVFKADSNGIYLGNETFSSAEFRVSPSGALTATNANITGSITATSGTFSGSLSGATGSIGNNFSIGTSLTIGASASIGNDLSIGNSVTIGNNVRINGAAGDGGISVLKIRADNQPDNNTSNPGRQPLSVVSYLNNSAFRVVYTGDCRYGASMALDSDIRLKKNIKQETLGLSFINLLNPVSFYWDKPEFSDQKKYRGFIAQEILDISKNFNDSFEGVFLEDSTNPESFLGLDYPQFISPIVKAIQELSAKVDELESRLV